jgi:hypothetical protein
MQFNSAPSNTLYVKVNFKRQPYSNNITAIRVVAHIYSDFVSNKALFLIDMCPDNTNILQVEDVVKTLQKQANSLNVSVTIAKPVYKRLVENVA